MLRPLLPLIFALLATLQGGCSVCQNAHRTTIEEPARFNWKHDRARSRELYRQWADQEWRSRGRIEAACDSPTYMKGFYEGFVEYVFAGGNGEPPPVPPREFWNADLRNEHGQSLADMWFAGYRHGARVAREGGYRDMVVVRSSLFNSAVGDVGAEGYSHPVPLEFYDSESEPHPAEVELVPPSRTYQDEQTRENVEAHQEEQLAPPPSDGSDPAANSGDKHDPFRDDPPPHEELPGMSVHEPQPMAAQTVFEQEPTRGGWQTAGTSSRSTPRRDVALETATQEATNFSDDPRSTNPFLR